MNNPNPFLSQGVFLDQKNKARTRLKIAVYSSISLSVLVLMALLIQGCHKPNDSVDNGSMPGNDSLANSQTQQVANSTPDSNSSNATTLTPPAPAADSNPAPVAPMTPAVTAPPPVATPPPPPVAEAQEYTIVAHDTYSTIATKNNTTARAIMNANPGVDPKKLKVGQKIKLPAPTSTTSTSAAPTAAPVATDTASSGGATTYKVKSGDSLTSIKKKFPGLTIKAIQQANNLGSSTSIKVGQVLKIPGGAAPAPAPEAAPVPAPVTAPAPTATPAPMH